MALNLLGVVTTYDAVSSVQAADFVNDDALADPRSRLVADLFASGLIDIASPYLGRGLGNTRGAAAYQLGERRSYVDSYNS